VRVRVTVRVTVTVRVRVTVTVRGFSLPFLYYCHIDHHYPVFTAIHGVCFMFGQTVF
jgi:hypothetical protein